MALVLVRAIMVKVKDMIEEAVVMVKEDCIAKEVMVDTKTTVDVMTIDGEVAATTKDPSHPTWDHPPRDLDVPCTNRLLHRPHHLHTPLQRRHLVIQRI
jgi:hypothetical protein